MTAKQTADDVLVGLEEISRVARCGTESIRRALVAGKLAGGKPGGEDGDRGGWHTTRGAVIEWVLAGMPGSERVDEAKS